MTLDKLLTYLRDRTNLYNEMPTKEEYLETLKLIEQTVDTQHVTKVYYDTLEHEYELLLAKVEMLEK